MQNEQFQGSNESQKEASLIMASVYNAIKNGQSPEDAYDALVARKIESKQAVMIVDSVVKYMIENDEYTEEDEETNKIAREEEEKKYENPNQEIEEQKDQEAENQMNQYNEQSLEIANDTSGIEQEEEDAANSSEDYLGFQYGGALGQAFEQEEEEEEESEEKYYEDDQIIKDQNNDFTSELERLSKSGIAQNFDYSNINNYQIPYQPIYEPNDYYENNLYSEDVSEYEDTSDSEDTLDYAKYGGKSNKKYASNVFSLLKKQDGGEEDNPENVENKTFEQATQTDDLKNSVKKKLTDFVGAVGMTSKKYKMDEWFKKMKEVNDPMLTEILDSTQKNKSKETLDQQAQKLLGNANSMSPNNEQQQNVMAYGGESSFQQFQKGGRFRRAIQKYFPGEILGKPKKSFNVVTRVYNPKTGQMTNLPTGDSKFDRVEVTKRNWLHQPKKYTVHYKNDKVSDIAPLVDSRNPALTNQSQKSNVDGLGLEARMAIRKGERKNERNNRRLKRQGINVNDYVPTEGAINNGERVIKDEEGNWYDRFGKMIPDKKSPSEVPGYYDYLYPKDNQSDPNKPVSNENQTDKKLVNIDEAYIKNEFPNLSDEKIKNMLEYVNLGGPSELDQSDKLNKARDYADEKIKNDAALLEGLEDLNKDGTVNYADYFQKENGPGYTDQGNGVWSRPYIETEETEGTKETEGTELAPYQNIKEAKLPSNRIDMAKFQNDMWDGLYGDEDDDKNGFSNAEEYFNNTLIPEYKIQTGEDYEPIWNDYGNTLDDRDVYLTKSDLESLEIPPSMTRDEFEVLYSSVVPEAQEYFESTFFDKYKNATGRDWIEEDNTPSNERIENMKKIRLKNRKQPKVNSFKNGGILNKFLPKKKVGGPPPCGTGETLDPNTNLCVANPVFNAQTFAPPNAPIDPSIAASNSGTQVKNAPINNFYANQESFKKPFEYTIDPSLDPDVIPRLPIRTAMTGTGPNGVPVASAALAAFNDSFKKKPLGDEETAIDVEEQNNRGKLTFGKNNTGVAEARINSVNTGIDVLDSLRRMNETNANQKQFYENTSSNNQYANKTTMDVGDYDPNSGILRPGDMGSTNNGRSAQYGGYMDEEEYYNPYVEEEEEEEEEEEYNYAKGGEKITYMSENQIRAFMAAGGQVEFL